MSLSQTINDRLKQAMRDKDELRLTVLRQIKTAIDNESIVLKKKDEGLDEDEMLKVIKRESKKRKDSITQFESADRNDLAENERAELEIIEEFLPEEMSAEDIEKTVDEIISEAGADAKAGQIIGMVVKKTEGRADGSVISKIVMEKLK